MKIIFILIHVSCSFCLPFEDLEGDEEGNPTTHPFKKGSTHGMKLIGRKKNDIIKIFSSFNKY